MTVTIVERFFCLFLLRASFRETSVDMESSLRKEPTFQTPALVSPARETHNNNNNYNNGLLTVYPPNGSSPVKNYNIKKEKL